MVPSNIVYCIEIKIPLRSLIRFSDKYEHYNAFNKMFLS